MTRRGYVSTGQFSAIWQHEAFRVSASPIAERRGMDIPNDLNRLLARLEQVARETSRMTGNEKPGSRPTADEIDCFLSQHNFDANAKIAKIERIEISKDGVFEFYTFAVWNRVTDELSLLAMRDGLFPGTDR
jgi:hypothetical protein